MIFVEKFSGAEQKNGGGEKDRERERKSNSQKKQTNEYTLTQKRVYNTFERLSTHTSSYKHTDTHFKIERR